jgi:hypothetical protein
MVGLDLELKFLIVKSVGVNWTTRELVINYTTNHQTPEGATIVSETTRTMRCPDSATLIRLFELAEKAVYKGRQEG